MENIVDAYKELEKTSLERQTGQTGQKAQEVRNFVKDLAKNLKQNRLLMSAAYNVCKEYFEGKGQKLDRTYFAQVVGKTWVTENVEGRVWIDLTKTKEKKGN